MMLKLVALGIFKRFRQNFGCDQSSILTSAFSTADTKVMRHEPAKKMLDLKTLP